MIHTLLRLCLLSSLIVLQSFKLEGQTDSAKVHNTDILEIAAHVLHIKDIKEQPDSLSKTHHPFFVIIPGIGYALQTSFTAAITANVSFYADNRPDANISTIIVQPIYTIKNQFILPVISNIWAEKNKINFQGDWRYYSNPSITYGLGGYSLLSNKDDINYSHLRIYQTGLVQIFPDLLIGPGYMLDYHWNITDNINGNENATDFKNYGYTRTSTSSGVSANLLYDTRRNANNPVPGNFLNVIYRPNLTALGSNTNWQSLIIDARKYVQVSATSKNILAFWAYEWFTVSGKPPFLDLPSTGWDTYANMARGYIQGRLRGNNLLYFESEYRFHLSRNGLFGGVVFANVQSVSEIPDNRFEVFYPAVGAGLRLKINKYSNLNFALDYGVGIDGSNGFFLNLGEAF